jgi:hypothetical protein
MALSARSPFSTAAADATVTSYIPAPAIAAAKGRVVLLALVEDEDGGVGAALADAAVAPATPSLAVADAVLASIDTAALTSGVGAHTALIRAAAAAQVFPSLNGSDAAAATAAAKLAALRIIAGAMSGLIGGGAASSSTSEVTRAGLEEGTLRLVSGSLAALTANASDLPPSTAQ